MIYHVLTLFKSAIMVWMIAQHYLNRLRPHLLNGFVQEVTLVERYG